MKVRIELTEKDLRRLVLHEIRTRLGDYGSQISETDVSIETKSNQNWKAEWEGGAGFRARLEKEVQA